MLSTSLIFFASALLFHSQANAQGGGPCLIYGPDFPAPRQPSKDTAVVAAVAALEKAIADAFNGDTTYGVLDSGNSTFSLDIYSTYETDSIWTYHHTGDAMKHDPEGVTSVDSNTVYALGSISKLLTVYTFLLEAGDTSWNDPVTKYIPELAAYAKAHPHAATQQIDHYNWEDITVGALVSQLSGMVRDVPEDHWEDDELADPNWPPPDVVEEGLCGKDGYFNAACNRTQFFELMAKRPPVVAAFQTAIYSNSAFTVLAHVLEAITGKSMKHLFNNGLVKRHGMNATYFNVPKNSNTSIIPLSYDWSYWNVNLHETIPAGGYFSTINDMRKMGRAMLNSTFLTAGQTRRWFQPRSFNADANGAIGAPFEMLKAPSTQKVSWIYTKAGDIGTYNTLVGYLPEFNVGFTVLNAFSSQAADGVDSNHLGNMIISIMYPALEAAAKAEAAAGYTGTYHDASSNSTVIITTDQYSGLSITEWTANGSDVRSTYLSLFAGSNFMRLVPVGLTNSKGGVTTDIAFRMIASATLMDDEDQIVTTVCFNWVEVDAFVYGYIGFDSFVFSVDPSGAALNVQPRAFRQTLKKVG